MQVKLAKPYFAPNASLYPAGIHTFPDEWNKRLPSTAEILEEPAPEPKSKKDDAPKAASKKVDLDI